MLKPIMIAAGLVALGATAASAHVTLETGEVVAGSSYKAVLRVPHGCEGSPTTRVSVRIPEGVIAVKPMPHAGWNVETVKGKYAKAYDFYGAARPRASPRSPGAAATCPTTTTTSSSSAACSPPTCRAGTIYFPVVQECENGVERWIEIPAAGKTADDYESPAPELTVLPKP